MSLVLQRCDDMFMPWRLSIALALGGLSLVPASANAQHAHGIDERPIARESGAATPHLEERTVSVKAGEQIAMVERAVAGLKTLDTLRAAGFRPVFGMIPTMGVHWVNVSRVLEKVKLLEPAQLLFSPVGGEPRLVGAAYSFLGQTAEAPDLFDGTQDVWHAHPELAPPGQSAVMLHIWFVPSPDGPFAGQNPWLPYWAAGVEPPADSVLSVPASALRARQLALALAEAVEPFSLVAQAQSGRSALEMAIAQVQDNVQAQSADSILTPSIQARRDSLRATIPRLNAARRAADQGLWDREADAAIAVWKRVRDAYLETLPPARRDGMAAFYQQMETGGHEH